MPEQQKLTYNEWELRFRPVKNHITDGRPFDGMMFETLDADLMHVWGTNVRRVWTLIGEGEESYILSGLHFVNRLGYFICENFWEEGAEFVVEFEKCEHSFTDADNEGIYGQQVCRYCGDEKPNVEDKGEL